MTISLSAAVDFVLLSLGDMTAFLTGLALVFPAETGSFFEAFASAAGTALLNVRIVVDYECN
jgi:hypothetical protein